MRDTSPPPCDITICVVNWNGRQLLEDLLRSIERHPSRRDCQVIVVDNASTDDSVKVVAERYPHVRVICNKDNAGFSRANNQAAQASTGGYLLFLNNDTQVTPGTIDAMADYLDAHADVVAIGPKLVFPDGSLQRTDHRVATTAWLMRRLLCVRRLGLFKRGERELGPPADYERTGDVEMIIGAAMLVRREAFFACGMWDEAFMFGVEDVDLCRRLASWGRIVYLADAVVMHHLYASAKKNTSFAYRAKEFGCLRYLRRYGPKRAARGYKLLVTMDLPLRMLDDALAVLRYAILRKPDPRARRAADLRAAISFFLRDLPRYWIRG